MVNWSGRKKFFTVLAFIAPTIIGLLIFNVYPIIYNTYISLTNRNQSHPNPDCEVALTGVIEPQCWPMFTKTTSGYSTPYRLQDPLFTNYTNLVGKLFTTESMLNLLRLIGVLVPLFIASYVNKRMDKMLSRPISGLVVWFLGLLGAVLMVFVLDAPSAYASLDKSGDFFIVVFRTILYVICCVPLFFVLGLALALILNGNFIKGRTAFRTIMIMPWAASTMAIMLSLIWQFFFRDAGTINQILKIIGIEGKAWLTDPGWAFFIVVLVNVWFSYPYFMSIILGALQSIPQEQYEAAEVDGANFMQRLTNITLPLIRPAVLPAVVLSSITTFQMFGTVWAITQGGPTRGAGTPGFTEMVMVYAYKQVFQSNAYGKAGAFAVIIFIFLFAATLLSMRTTKITKGAYE